MPTPPTLDNVRAINVRSAVEQVGSIAFSDPMMNNVQHNMLWGQSTNLMMVPTDCDQVIAGTFCHHSSIIDMFSSHSCDSLFINPRNPLFGTEPPAWPTPSRRLGLGLDAGPAEGRLPAGTDPDPEPDTELFLCP